MKWYIYNVNTLDNQTFNRFFGLLTPKRKEYVLSLKKEKSRKLTVTGEMLAKNAISELYKISIEDIIIECDPSGKPIVKNCDAKISISHSGDIAVCAVDTEPIGIDIEKIRDVSLKTAYRFSNSEEIYYIFDSDDTKESERRFFEIWTAKEAEYKRLDGQIKNFKEIDTRSINKDYYEYSGYLICISHK